MGRIEDAAIKVNGESIGLHALIQRARMRGQTQFVDEAIHMAIVRETACMLNLRVSREEAQKAANEFRERHNLLKAQDAVKWLEERGLTVADWQKALEEDVIVAKLKKEQFDSKVEVFFAERKLDYDRATIERISTPTEGLASELLLQIKEEGAVFEDVARKFSIDNKTKETGGYVGKVTRKDLVPAASSAVFGGEAGSVYGPFKAGKDYHLYRVIALHPALLDNETREQIRERLYREWLADMRAKADISIPLYDVAHAVVEAV